MNDIVERLERLANWGGNATHLDYEGAILDAKAEIERLEADNERLRAALLEILDSVAVTASGVEICQCSDFDFARAALEGKDE